jgi:hypothetical protein
VKIRMLEIECEGPAVAEAVRAFGGLVLSGPRAAAQPAPALPAPAIRVAQPAKAARTVRQAKPAQAPAAEADEQGQKVGDLILQALREGPKTNQEVAEFLRSHGRPEYLPKQASAALVYLRSVGKVKLDGRVWSL